MNLFDYIVKYENVSFDEMPFNEVDNAIFSALSYVNLKGIVSNNWYNKTTIREAVLKYFQLYSGKEKNILPIKHAIEVFEAIGDTKRYGNLYLYNYVYEANDDVQFSAITIEIGPKLIYVSFEGTDQLISGWKEDFMMTYMFPIPSQKKAINYVNRKLIFNRKQIILGGHSKGGNLSVVAGMYANIFVRNRIINIYNNDGPGLLKEYFESDKYRCISDKLISIIPDYSIVGILLYHSLDYVVVSSAKKGAIAHDICTWVVNDNEFLRSELDAYSKALEEELRIWLEKYTRKERESFVLSIFDVFERANIVSLIDILENKMLIFDLISESKELSDADREMLRDFLGMIFNCFKEVKIDEFKKIFDNRDNEIEV